MIIKIVILTTEYKYHQSFILDQDIYIVNVFAHVISNASLEYIILGKHL